MATINQIARDRRAALRVLLRDWRAADTAGESLERKIRRLINLRRNVPTLDQYLELVEATRLADRSLDAFTRSLQRVGRVFSL